MQSPNLTSAFTKLLFFTIIIHSILVHSQLVIISGQIFDKVTIISNDGKSSKTVYTPVNQVQDNKVTLTQASQSNILPPSISTSSLQTQTNNGNGKANNGQGNQKLLDNQKSQGNTKSQGNIKGNDKPQKIKKKTQNSINLQSTSSQTTPTTNAHNSGKKNLKTNSVPLPMNIINSDIPTYSIIQDDTLATLQLPPLDAGSTDSLTTDQLQISMQLPQQTSENSQTNDVNIASTQSAPPSEPTSTSTQSMQQPTNLALPTSLFQNFGDVASPFTQLKTTGIPDANNNLSSDNTNQIIGVNNTVDGQYNDLIGNQNIINDGNNNTIRGDSNVITNGNNNIIMSDGSFVMGSRNIIY